MTKAEKYIKTHPEYDMYLLDKKFGNGKQLIQFFYRGIVLDPFIGSGTTAVVAKKLDRHFIGFELNPDYVEISNKRLYNTIGLFL